MAPLNGAAGKPAKTVSRRVASKPVVPVLPLNYPQRPFASRPSSTPSTASPSTPAHPNGVLQDKTNQINGPVASPTHLESPVELRNEGGQSLGGNLDTAHRVAPAQPASASASGAPTTTSSEKLAGKTNPCFSSKRGGCGAAAQINCTHTTIQRLLSRLSPSLTMLWLRRRPLDLPRPNPVLSMACAFPTSYTIRPPPASNPPWSIDHHFTSQAVSRWPSR